MFIKKLIFGLKNVDITFYMPGSSKVSNDFIAGKYGFMASGCRICPRVSVKNYVMFGPNVTITGSDHRFDMPGVPMIFSGRPPLNETKIESDVWIGNGALIMSGVTINRGAIVAAHSVVTKDIPAYEIHGGVPAKKIKSRFNSPDDIMTHELMLKNLPFQGDFCKNLGH